MVQFLEGARTLFSTAFRLALQSIQSPSQWPPGALPQGKSGQAVKQITYSTQNPGH